jgi:hypothetical protein
MAHCGSEGGLVIVIDLGTSTSARFEAGRSFNSGGGRARAKPKASGLVINLSTSSQLQLQFHQVRRNPNNTPTPKPKRQCPRQLLPHLCHRFQLQLNPNPCFQTGGGWNFLAWLVSCTYNDHSIDEFRHC